MGKAKQTNEIDKINVLIVHLYFSSLPNTSAKYIRNLSKIELVIAIQILHA